MGMGNRYRNEDEPLGKPHYRSKHNDVDDQLLECTTSGSSSSLSSPVESPSSSSSSSSSPPFCYDDQPDSPEPQSPIPVSYPDVTTSPHKWSMIISSPIGQPSGYDPNRIPLSVFGSRSSAPMEWSVASTESLFSIHVGNNSFSRDRAMSLSRSEDGGCEDKRCNNGRKSFSSTLAPVIEGALDSEEKSELASEALQVQESNHGSPQQSSEEINKIAASQEVHSFAMKSNSSDGRETSRASNPHHLSDDSGTSSSSSFAFPVLVNDSLHGSSLKSVPEKPESEQKSQPEEDSKSQAEAESSKEEEEVSAYGIGWFSYLFCLRRCC
nr:circumsporozoite protein-like [Ipomoea batatas]